MRRVPKIIAVLIIAVCATQVWSNRRDLLFYFFESRNRPEKLALNEQPAGPIIFHYSKSPYLTANIDALSRKAYQNLLEAEKQLDYQLEKPLHLYLFANWEEKGNYCGDIRIAHAEPDENSVYCIVNEEWNGLEERKEYEVLLQNKYGNPFNPEYAEFAAAALSGKWFGRTLEQWQDFLTSRNLTPDIPAVLTDMQASRFIRVPWGAILMRFIREKYGLPAMIAFYKNGTIRPDAFAEYRKKLSQPKSDPPEPHSFPMEFQKGINYAYSNSYDAGYPTAKSDLSLEYLQELGVNWIASIPYGFMRSNNANSIRFVGHHIAGESDESLWALTESAHRKKIKVMLKPQLWVRGTWVGGIDFHSQTEWNEWMNNYEKWITHYAIIAELTKTDLFCIGTELVQATIKNPDQWRTMIHHIRQIYHGPITYASNWGKEFEQIAFWNDLDYIGVDNYYPVRHADSDGLTEMKKAFDDQKQMIKSFAVRYHRPVLFTEIGYMANSKAGMGPKEYEASDSDYNESAQNACYRLAIETYWNEPWFAGMYWWKWFSEPGDSGRTADAHSPHGRLAERTIKEWYSRSRSAEVHAR